MQLTIVTGLSGAGKSITLNCLEDLGYYCIDNLPPALMESFIDLAEGSEFDVTKIAFCIDVRAGALIKDMDKCLDLLKERNIDYKIIYLEASDDVLIRRYKESRRFHPLCASNISEGIAKERQLLASLRERADNIFDTSKTKTANFSEAFRKVVLNEEESAFLINIYSFGFKHGLPMDADIVLDVRFIPNPFYVPSLRELTGNSKKVSEYVLKKDITQKFIDDLLNMWKYTFPCYMKEGKYSMNIACGCTGGHHRSVAIVNELARRLKERKYNVNVEHRDL